MYICCVLDGNIHIFATTQQDGPFQYIYIYIYSFIHSFIHSLEFSLRGRVAGTRAQSCDRYGSGTLHPGQVLGDSLALLSPAFRRSQFRRQVPVRPQRREGS